MTTGILAMMQGEGQYQLRTRRRWFALSDETRNAIERRFERHRLACEKLGIGPDPMWVMEAVADASSASNARARMQHAA